MSDEKRQIKQIGADISAPPPEERARYLEKSGNGSQSRRNDLEAFLSSSETNSLNQPDLNIFPEKINQQNNKFATGARFAHYEIICSLGAGGMGEVYLAEDLKLKRKVALKFLSAQNAPDLHQLSRFNREALAASALNHPNILTVYEIGEQAGVHFIATEFIDGKTLREILQDRANLSRQKLLSIAVQTAEALAAAHASGIVHRDIKPENIMVRADGYAKVLDFGLAKLNQAVTIESDPEDLTQKLLKTNPGTVMGTVRYMSPEQTRGLESVDARTDVWSLGVCLYEMFAGRLPFDGATVSDIIAAILKSEPTALSEIVSDCPQELERIVTKTLEKDREERYQVIKDLALDLKRLSREFESSAPAKRVTNEQRGVATNEVSRSFTESFSLQRFSQFQLLSILFLTFLGLGAAWWFFAANKPTVETLEPTALKNVEIVTWSSSPGEFYTTGSFSPDAKMIAFTSTKIGGRNIWIKQTTSGEAVQITKDENRNGNPIWSPGGEELAFFSTRGNQAGIWRIPVLGGSPVLAAELEDASGLLRLWSQKDIIYYELKRNLYAIDLKSGKNQKITAFDPKQVNYALSISPDERRIAYVSSAGKEWQVWTKPLDAAPKLLFVSDTEIKNTAWHPDNKRVFYSRLVDETYQIFVTDIDAAQPKQITFTEKDSFVLDVSRDGSRILYGSAKEESDLWSVRLDDNKEFTVASDINSELWANVSPDGKTLVFQSIKNLNQGNKIFTGAILTKRLDSNESPVQLATNASLPVWSPDGKHIGFLQFNGDKYQIASIKATGGEQKAIVTEGISPINFTVLPYNRIQTADFSWSPDSAKIAFISNESGQYNVSVINADGSGKTLLTANNDANLFLDCPLWSSDGGRIVFTSKISSSSSKTNYGVWITDAETKNSKQIFQKDAFLRLIGWSESGAELILATTNRPALTGLQMEVNLSLVEIETGRWREIATLKDAYLYNIHLSPDKKTIAFAAHRDDTDNIWLIPASGGEERKMTANSDARLYFSSLAWSSDGKAIFFGKQSRYSLLSMLTNFK